MSTTKYFDISGNVPSSGANDNSGQVPYNYTIYDLEKKVFDSLNDFNRIYSQYLRCSTQITDTERDININRALRDTSSSRGCSEQDKNITLNNVTQASIVVSDKIEAYKKAYSTFPIDDTRAQASREKVTTLVNNYNSIVQKRNELDSIMIELNRTKDSQYMEWKGYDDSTKYANILLTVLATSLIYYIFVKL